MKDGEFTCLDDILAKIKPFSTAEKCRYDKWNHNHVSELHLVNPRQHKEDLVIWQYLTPSNREQTNFVLY